MIAQRNVNFSNYLFSSTFDLSEATYDYRKSVLYVTKAIALILNEPLVFAAEKVLLTMQKYVCKNDFDLQVLESLVFNLLYDIPLPSPGRSVRFWCLGEIVNISMPKIPVELPQFDYNLLEIFDMLGVENVVKLIIIVLLENQVLGKYSNKMSLETIFGHKYFKRKFGYFFEKIMEKLNIFKCWFIFILKFALLKNIL